MKVVLDKLRRHRELHEKVRKFYGKTIGLWWMKEWYIKNVGFWNGKKRLKLFNLCESDKIIAEKIKSGKPFMMARYGSTEFRTLFDKNNMGNLCHYSGFFPKKNKLWKKFKEIYMQASQLIDILMIWNYKNHFIDKRQLISKLKNIETIVPLSATGPFNCSWLKELEGKRILVIHPFKSSIESQYKKRAELKLLPKFKSLKIIQAVQTLAGNKDKRFETWFDALNYMKKKIDKENFDVALIGCGAYGLPLAAYVKSIGKQGLHIGGGLQLFFGIKGKRWDEDKVTKYNRYWIHPMEKDFFNNYKKVEGGCYW